MNMLHGLPNVMRGLFLISLLSLLIVGAQAAGGQHDLQTENLELRAENHELRAEIESLRRARINHEYEDLESDLEADSDATWKKKINWKKARDAAKAAKQAAAKAAAKAAKAAKQAAAKAAAKVAKAAKAAKDALKKKCPNQCLGDCGIPKKVLNRKCKAPKSMLTWIKKTVAYKGREAMSWDILNDRSGDQTYKQRIIGKVSCPCHESGGKKLSEDDALRIILGQVAVVKTPKVSLLDVKKWASKAAVERAREVKTNMKISYSTLLLLRCWKAQCYGSKDGASSDLQLAGGFGGGASC